MDEPAHESGWKAKPSETRQFRSIGLEKEKSSPLFTDMSGMPQEVGSVS